jgi:hypothetical protein
MHDFWDQFRTDDNHADLRKIFFEAGIQKSDRFESNDDASAAAPIDTNTTIEAQLNYGDTDNYAIDVDANEEVTVSIDRQLGDSDFSLAVYGPEGSLVAESRSEGVVDEELTFTAESSGDYRVWVGDHANQHTAGAYSLSVEAVPAASDDVDWDLTPVGTDDVLFGEPTDVENTNVGTEVNVSDVDLEGDDTEQETSSEESDSSDDQQDSEESEDGLFGGGGPGFSLPLVAACLVAVAVVSRRRDDTA